MEPDSVNGDGAPTTPAEDEAIMADKFLEVIAMFVTNDMTFEFLSENEDG